MKKAMITILILFLGCSAGYSIFKAKSVKTDYATVVSVAKQASVVIAKEIAAVKAIADAKAAVVEGKVVEGKIK